ncbi:MAG: prephenate dehydrogenase [Fusobacteriaceae bacterium]
MKDFKITVVGLGVIGGAFAEGLKHLGATVYGVDINERTLEFAKEKGIIDEGFLLGKEPLLQSDIVIISLYPSLLKDFIIENITYFKKNAIITDVSGIKESIISQVEGLLREDLDFIYGHPMAGKEKQGIEYADLKVFQNANYILIKSEKNKEKNLILMEKIIKGLGFKNINYLTAREHDETIAFTSQLTHILAVALINSDDEKNDISKFIGDSFRDLTRISKINADLWCELFLGNKNNLINKIEVFQDELSKLKILLESENSNLLKREFRKSTKRREKLDK